jgi:hypothetical protein
MNSIEAYIQFTPGLITDDGEVTDDAVGDFLRNYMAEFPGFITRSIRHYLEMPDSCGVSVFLPHSFAVRGLAAAAVSADSTVPPYPPSGG